MKLIAWIPCLLLGFLVFMICYAFTQGAGGLAGRAGAAAACAAYVAAGAATLGLYELWNRLWDRITGVHWADDLSLKRCLPDIGKGFLTGIVYFAIVVGIIALCGCYRITDVKFDLLPQLKALTLFFTVAVCEEILFRGILFKLIDRQFNTVAAYIVSALVFGFVHISNPGATWWAALAIAVEAGIMLSAAYKYSGNLWMPSASTGPGTTPRATSWASGSPAAMPARACSSPRSPVPTLSPAAPSEPKLPSSPSPSAPSSPSFSSSPPSAALPATPSPDRPLFPVFFPRSSSPLLSCSSSPVADTHPRKNAVSSHSTYYPSAEPKRLP